MSVLPSCQTVATLLCVFLAVSSLGAKPLQLTDTRGKTIKAEVLGLSGDKVRLEMKGKEYTLPLSRFSAESQALLQEAGQKGEQLNQALGQPLFTPGKTLWEEPAETLAKRLEWPEESKTPYTSSYRLYPRESYLFAGAPARTAVAYGNEKGHTELLSIIFSNKGDTLSSVGSGEDHFDERGTKINPETLAGAMKLDEVRISKALTSILGPPEDQAMFAQGSSKIKNKRWDWNGHSFLLSLSDEEYVRLRVAPISFAEAGGKTERISDQDMRKRLASNVTRNSAGDVYIDNIPMVDQGPKGYCAPATFERAMRHAGVAADMYLLATLATSPGGGTYTELLYDKVAFTTRSKGGRSAKEITLNSLQPGRIKRYIEKGVPVLWRMRSVSSYNDIANERSKARKDVKNWGDWARKVDAEAEKNLPGLRNGTNYHICLIVGYNENTGELAVSDSWGPEYERRWIHWKEAEAVSQRGAYLIDL